MKRTCALAIAMLLLGACDPGVSETGKTEPDVAAQLFECTADVECPRGPDVFSARICAATIRHAEELTVGQCLYGANGVAPACLLSPSSPDSCMARCSATGDACVAMDEYALKVGAALCSRELACGDGTYAYEDCMASMEGTERVFRSAAWEDGAIYDPACAADWIERLRAATCDEFNNWTGPLACALTCKPLYGHAGAGDGCGDDHHACGRGLACQDDVCVNRCGDLDGPSEAPEPGPR